MTELHRDIHVVRNNDGSIQATVNGEPADPNDPRVQEALALMDQANTAPGVHTNARCDGEWSSRHADRRDTRW